MDSSLQSFRNLHHDDWIDQEMASPASLQLPGVRSLAMPQVLFQLPIDHVDF